MVRFKFDIKACWYLHLICSVHSARILGIFPFAARSHFNFNEAIMKSLLQAGHRVTIIAPFQPQDHHGNLTFINSDIVKNDDIESLGSVADTSLSWFSTALIFLDWMELNCKQVLSLDNMKDLKNFDVILVEALPMYQCHFPMAEKLKIPIIGTISTRSMVDADMSVGMSRFPSVFPTDDELFPWHRNPIMTFFQKITNVLHEVQIRTFYFLAERRANKFNEKYFPESEWSRVRFPVLFMNDHGIFLPRAKPPNAINIGGIHVKSSLLKPLPQEFKKFIEEARHGVILFSLGSITPEHILNAELKNRIRDVFAKIPQRVIWKSADQIAGLPENILLSKWVPQKEILAHENVVAFISHCGLSSTYESIQFGKPMILIPLFGDQPSTAAYLNSLEVGLFVDFMKLEEKILLDAINKVINDTKYRENMADLSLKFKTEAKTPAELVVYWTEYVLRHKGSTHFRIVEADVPFYQFLLLDVLSLVLLIALISGYLFFWFIKLLKR